MVEGRVESGWGVGGGGWGVGGGGDTSIAGDGGQCACGVGGGEGWWRNQYSWRWRSIAHVVVGGRVESVGGRGLWWRNQIAEELKNLCHEKNY